MCLCFTQASTYKGGQEVPVSQDLGGVPPLLGYLCHPAGSGAGVVGGVPDCPAHRRVDSLDPDAASLDSYVHRPRDCEVGACLLLRRGQLSRRRD